MPEEMHLEQGVYDSEENREEGSGYIVTKTMAVGDGLVPLVNSQVDRALSKNINKNKRTKKVT